MELVLTIIAGLGGLLFLIGYLGFVVSGFRHHFVTGVISVLPVLNIVTVPALWGKASKKLMISILGVVIVVASWFFGADASIKRIVFGSGDNNLGGRTANNNFQKPVQNFSLSSDSNNKAQSSTQGVAVPNIPKQNNQTSAVKPFANQQRFINERNMQSLPKKALYILAFESISVDKITTLKNRVVEITINSNEVFEGRITKVSNSSVFLLSRSTILVENEFPLANIKRLRLMVKKAIK